MTASRFYLALALLTATAACSSSSNNELARVTVIEDGASKIAPARPDMHYASASARAAIAKGLVAFDEQGRVVPALAVRWIVTDDGLSYIFRLHDAKWSDGRDITSERVAKLLKDRIRELENSRLGDDLVAIDEIISMTGSVIEIRLNSPHPNFLQLLAQPEFGLFRSGHGAGPMQTVAKEKLFTLERFENATSDNGENDEADESEPDPRRVTLRTERAAAAVARYAAGHTDIILNGKFQQLPLLEAASINSGDIKLDPVAGLFGLKFVRAEGFWGNAKNRELLAMAIDRPALLTSFPAVTAWQARQKIIPEALDVADIDTRPDWADMTLDARRAFASDQVSKWKAANGQIEPLSIILPQGAGSRILFARIKADLQRVGMDAVRVASGKSSDVILIDEIAPYDSAQWFVSRLTCKHTVVCMAEADNAIKAGENSANLNGKARFFAEAERLLVQHYNYIPLAVPVRWSLVRSGRDGFGVNSRGWHPLNTLVGIPIS